MATANSSLSVRLARVAMLSTAACGPDKLTLHTQQPMFAPIQVGILDETDI
jgi:hypothetical protein